MSRQNVHFTLPNNCAAYCDCDFPKCLGTTNYKGPITNLVNCRCGEEGRTLVWQWQCNERDTLINGPDITFHPTYSQGTAVVRGDRSLKSGMVHYWEMRILTPLFGTDVMFGIGTDKVDVHKYKFDFISALGIDDQSWGFSFNGRLQHKSKTRKYGQTFSQGCILGIYLDRTYGYLEYFLNRRSLGVAYKNIPTNSNVKIYPMICCTSAKTAVRLISTASEEESLQLRAFQMYIKQSNAMNDLREIPGLRTIFKTYWFLALPVRYSSWSSKDVCSIDDEVVLPKSRLKRKQTFKVDDDIDVNDLYSNAHKIVAHERCESDDECDDLMYLL